MGKFLYLRSGVDKLQPVTKSACLLFLFHLWAWNSSYILSRLKKDQKKNNIARHIKTYEILVSGSINKVLLDNSIIICLYIIYDSFYGTMEKLNSYYRDNTSHTSIGPLCSQCIRILIPFVLLLLELEQVSMPTYLTVDIEETLKNWTFLQLGYTLAYMISSVKNRFYIFKCQFLFIRERRRKIAFMKCLSRYNISCKKKVKI